jgi:hypothetical protein
MKAFALALSLVVLTSSASEAKQTKLYYLRIGYGEHSPVYGVKSLKLCEVKAAELNKILQKFDKKASKNYARCLKTMPVGFVRAN